MTEEPPGPQVRRSGGTTSNLVTRRKFLLKQGGLFSVGGTLFLGDNLVTNRAVHVVRRDLCLSRVVTLDVVSRRAFAEKV